MAKKTKKEKRNIKATKLPKMFKKSYTKKKLDSKILKHLYIPEDKKLVESLFKKGNNPSKPELYAYDKSKLYTKNELKQYKRLSVEIKSHKGRFNGGAFGAVAIFIAVLCALVVTFKDPLIKLGIKKGCESIFEAKTSVEYVNLNLKDSSLTVKNLVVGDSYNEYKNLFQIGTIQVDVNIVQALRGHFIAENLECSGMEFGTERTTSCKLPASAKKDSNKAKKSQTNKSIEEKKNEAIAKIQRGVMAAFGGSDTSSIVDSVTANLSSPKVIEEATKQTEELIAKYQNTPAQLQKDGTDFYNSANQLINLDVSQINDVNTLLKDIELANQAITKGTKFANEVTTTCTELNADYAKVQVTKANVDKAISADKAYAEKTLKSAAGIYDSAKSIFTNGLDSIGYYVLGKYYPIAQKGISYARALKDQSSKKTTAKNVKKNQNRMKGITYYYGSPYPKFLIEKIHATGPGFTATITEFTNDQNVRNIPMTIKGSYEFKGIKHSGNFVVDARTASKAPLIQVSYTGSGYYLDFDGTTVAQKSGVPSIKGVATITLTGSGDVDYFDATGSVYMKNAKLTSDGFDDPQITKYYQQALAQVNTLNVGYKIKYAQQDVSLNLTGDFAQQFVTALTKVATGSSGQNQDAYNQVMQQINGSSKEYTQKLNEFTALQKQVNAQNTQVTQTQQQLQNKITQMQQQSTASSTNQAINAAKSYLKF